MKLSDNEYAQIYQIIDRNKHHKRIIDYIIKKIINHSTKGSYLDIGAGDGKITHVIAKHFKQTVALEPNTVFLNKLQKDKHIHAIGQDFLSVHLNQQFDFILCCHVLYYIDLIDWESFIIKAYNLLNQGGTALFVMGADQGDNYKLYQKYNKNYGSSREIKTILSRYAIDFSTEILPDCYITETFEDMQKLAKFCVLSNCFNERSTSSIEDYTDNEIQIIYNDYALSKKHSDERYVMKRFPEYILISKQA